MTINKIDSRFVENKGNGKSIRDEIDQTNEQLAKKAQQTDLDIAEQNINELQIDKADKMEVRKSNVLITLADLTQDVKESMTGGSVAVVDVNAVGEQNIINDSVNESKVPFLEIGNNIFNKDKMQFGYYLASGGEPASNNDNWGVTDFIKVEPNTEYSMNLHGQYSYYYDVNYQKIDLISTTTISQYHRTFTTPSNAVYVRFSYDIDNTNSYRPLEETIINKGNELIEYEPYQITVKNEKPITNIAEKAIKHKHLEDKSVDINNLVFMQRTDNLFDKLNIEMDKIIDTSNGSTKITQEGSFYTVDFIPVEPSTDYYLNTTGYIYFYQTDSENSYVSFQQTSGLITTPSDCNHIKLGFQNKDKDTIMIHQGTKERNYIAYYAFPIQYVDLSYFQPKIPSNWDDKKVCTFGDSITEGNKWQPYLSNKYGFIISNKGVGGSPVAGNATDAMWQDDRINDIPLDTELLFFMGGSNDWSQNIPLGTIDNNSDTSTFYGAYQTVLEKVYDRIPDSRVILLLQPFRANMTENTEGLILEDYREATRQIAKKYGYPIVNTLEAGINQLNYETYLSDVVHPNDEGGKRIAEIIIGRLKQLEPIS